METAVLFVLMIGRGRMIGESWRGTPIVTGPAEAVTLIGFPTGTHRGLPLTMLKMLIMAGTRGMLMRKIGLTTGRLAQEEKQGVGPILIGLEKFGEVEINTPGINLRLQVIEVKIRNTGTMTKILIELEKPEMEEEIAVGVLMITRTITDLLVRNQEHMGKIQLQVEKAVQQD